MKEIIELLERRGFFIDEVDGKYYLSDNAHVYDGEYLNEILQDNNVGYMTEEQEIIIEDNTPEKLQYLFTCGKTPGGSESYGSDRGWWTVQKRRCADKCPVIMLEANVARYVKALNSIGMYTCGCCDGLHRGCDTLYVEFEGPISRQFTEVIWDNCLKQFKLNWIVLGSRLNLKVDRQRQYDTLNEAAKYIYEHREQFRRLRMDSMVWMTNRLEKRLSNKEKEERFFIEVHKSIKEWIE